MGPGGVGAGGNNNGERGGQGGCSGDNSSYGQIVGYTDHNSDLAYDDANCEGRFSCAIDNGPMTVDVKCNNTDGPCFIQAGSSSTISWTVDKTYTNATTCTASGDWSGAIWSGTDFARSGSKGTGTLSVSRPYSYILTCSNVLGGA